MIRQNLKCDWSILDVDKDGWIKEISKHIVEFNVENLSTCDDNHGRQGVVPSKRIHTYGSSFLLWLIWFMIDIKNKNKDGSWQEWTHQTLL